MFDVTEVYSRALRWVGLLRYGLVSIRGFLGMTHNSTVIGKS